MIQPPERRSLTRYLLSERYTDTVAHGLFHFTVIMLAFIIGNVWASHDAELRDLRGQYSVLLPLQQELQRFRNVAVFNRVYPPMPASQPSGPEKYAAAATPCQVGFRAVYTADTAAWQSIRQEDRYYLLADWPFYQELDQIYQTAESVRDATSNAATRTDCAKAWDRIAKGLVPFSARINAHMADLRDQYSAPWWRWPVSNYHLRILVYTLVGLVIVLALPLLLRAGEETLRRWPSARATEGAAAATAIPMPAGGAPAPAAPGEPSVPAISTGAGDAGVTVAGAATTIGSR